MAKNRRGNPPKQEAPPPPPPPPKGLWNILHHYAGVVIKDAVIIEAAKKGVEKIVQHVTEDRRSDLFRDIKELTEWDSEATKNLRARLKQAADEGRESILVKLLCKIPTDEKEGTSRKESLLWLNLLTEEEFKDAVYLLQNDNFAQFVARGTHELEEMGKNILSQFAPKGSIDSLAGKLGMEIRSLRLTLEKKGVRS